jgi:cell shape-determining protein MreC
MKFSALPLAAALLFGAAIPASAQNTQECAAKLTSFAKRASSELARHRADIVPEIVQAISEILKEIKQTDLTAAEPAEARKHRAELTDMTEALKQSAAELDEASDLLDRSYALAKKRGDAAELDKIDEQRSDLKKVAAGLALMRAVVQASSDFSYCIAPAK